jgi:NADH-quinone oxidoreductase subunit L
MLGPLLILALLSICGGWIGIERSGGWVNMERFSSFLAPVVGVRSAEAGSAGLEFRMSVAAVVVAFLGWYIAHVFYQLRPSRRAEFAASLSGPYTVLANKYYVDEFYNATVVKPLLAISTYFLGWVVDKALLGGAAWLLGGLALFTGALLQRWQSGNLRSYAAWLAAGAAAVLLFVVVPWSAFLANFGIHLNMAGR